MKKVSNESTVVSTEIGLRELRRRISVKTFLLFVTILHLRCPIYKNIQFDVTDLWIHNYIMIACLVSLGFLCGSVVKCLTRNTGVPGSSRTRSPGFFSRECPWGRPFRAQPSTTGETQERHEECELSP